MKTTLALTPTSPNLARTGHDAPKPDACALDSGVGETGESAETLELFAAIHKSTRFSVNSAHQLFAGVRRAAK